MIDIKELRIGSHIKCGGDIHQIVELNIIDAPSPLMRGVLCDKDFSVFSYPKTLNIDYIEPIPITAELLAELGFEKKSYNDIEQWSNWIKNGVGVHCFKGKSTYVQLSNSDTLNECYMPCEYLHELEFFYYHVFKKELIEE